MRVSVPLLATSFACLSVSDAFAQQVYDTGKVTSALWSHTTQICGDSCTERGTVTIGQGYPPAGYPGSPRAFVAGWKCDWLGGREDVVSEFGIFVTETSYDPATGDLAYELTTTLRRDPLVDQEFACEVRLAAIGGLPGSVELYVDSDGCNGTDQCATGGPNAGAVPLSMEWAGVVLRRFHVLSSAGGVPVDRIGVVTTSSRVGTSVDVQLGCSLTDGTGVPMGCEAEWMSVATGPGDAWGRADDASVDYTDLYFGTTTPDALYPLAGTTCGQSGWYLEFHKGAAPLAGLASGYAECNPEVTTTTNTWMTWLGDTYGTTATSHFYGRHLGTALFLY